ncbi:hypothetical protein J437_LFUL006290, partial [Ladona fulva]
MFCGSAIMTAAMEMLAGSDAAKSSRKPEIMADAAYAVFQKDASSCTGKFLIDEDVLQEAGVTDLDQYACDPSNKDNLMPDFFLDAPPAEQVMQSSSKKTAGTDLDAIFAGIQKSLSEELVAKVQASYLFNVKGDPPSSYFVDLKSGKGAAGAGEPPSPPDATLAMTAKDFAAMFSGEYRYLLYFSLSFVCVLVLREVKNGILRYNSPIAQKLSKEIFMKSLIANRLKKHHIKLAGRTIFITGASRGIGKAIALKAAKDGANIIIAAKTAEPHPKLPGTIYTAAEEVEAAGGKCLPCIVDVRDESQIVNAVESAVKKFGGIDILVNNASAISLTPTLSTEMKRYDLMHSINTRGTFLVSKVCLPHLKKGKNPHILNISPPLNMNPIWFKNHVAYTMAKYGMSMCVLGM